MHEPIDDLVSYLTAKQLILAFEPVGRMKKAGYKTVAEFFNKHGWHLTVREIREILDRESK